MKLSCAPYLVVAVFSLSAACAPNDGEPSLHSSLETVDDIRPPSPEYEDFRVSFTEGDALVHNTRAFSHAPHKSPINGVTGKDFPVPAAPARVAVDAGHHNYHTLAGTYAAFGEVLREEGFDVYSIAETFTDESLSEVDILVIANAQNEEDINFSDWSLPNYSAFTQNEIAAVERWVAAGGALFLVADHMPMAAGGKELADAFGFTFIDGFLVTASARNCAPQTFSAENGRLADHPILRGNTPEAQIDKVLSFCGQAFGYPPDATPILGLDENAVVVLPEENWEWDDETDIIAASPLAQGAVMQYGVGRVAMFGEAQIFTCKDENRGMCHPDATQNRRFLRNTFQWLDGEL